MCCHSGSKHDSHLTVYRITHLFVTVVLYCEELRRLLVDALVSVEARHISYVGLYDCSSGDFGRLMGMMECELLSREGERVRREGPPTPLYCHSRARIQTCNLQETS